MAFNQAVLQIIKNSIEDVYLDMKMYCLCFWDISTWDTPTDGVLFSREISTAVNI